MKIETFELERWMTRWELEVSHDITESGIAPMSIGELMSRIPQSEATALQHSIWDTPQGYSEARGTIQLRSLLAETYSGVTADDIIVTTGAIEANFLAFNTLLSPGDHVVAVSPAYQQLHSVPRAIGVELDLWDVSAADGTYRYDLDQLEALLRADTRMIVINTPHNPTGAVLDSSQIDEVINLARERGAWILSDEAYRWLEYPGGERTVEPTRNRYERAISVTTVSKPFGMPGLRIGWMAATEELATAAWAMRDYVTLSPAKISDAVTCALIRNRESVMSRAHEIMSTNLATARAWFAENGDVATWNEPCAGLLAMMRYASELDSRTVADRLAAEAGVMLAPGAAFGLEGSLRIGLGQQPQIFTEALERTEDWFRKLK